MLLLRNRAGSEVGGEVRREEKMKETNIDQKMVNEKDDDELRSESGNAWCAVTSCPFVSAGDEHERLPSVSYLHEMSQSVPLKFVGHGYEKE